VVEKGVSAVSRSSLREAAWRFFSRVSRSTSARRSWTLASSSVNLRCWQCKLLGQSPQAPALINYVSSISIISAGVRYSQSFSCKTRLINFIGPQS
jgi:hypothetical protein